MLERAGALRSAVSFLERSQRDDEPAFAIRRIMTALRPPGRHQPLAQVAPRPAATCPIVSARRRTRRQSIGGAPCGTPGRCRGTRTRRAPAARRQCTGVGNISASPSTPTGMTGASASTTTSRRAVAAVSPRPCRHAAGTLSLRRRYRLSRKAPPARRSPVAPGAPVRPSRPSHRGCCSPARPGDHP